MKKIISLLLVLVMLASVGVTAMAEDVPFSLDKTSIVLRVGETATLTASGAQAQDIIWTSTDPSVAAMMDDGSIIGTKLGITTFIATTPDGRSASCVIHVVLKGIDVSSWQKTIDWNNVKADGTDFALIREGYGDENWDNQTDNCFAANYAGASNAGIKVGVYHYSYAMNVQQAVLEANMCLYILKKYNVKLDYPVFYDQENTTTGFNQASLTSEVRTAMVNAFCSTIEAGGYKAGLYTCTNWYNNKLISSKLNPFDLWIAQYGGDTPNITNPFTIWQYTSSGHVAGISTAMDMNYSYVDYSSSGPFPIDNPDPAPIPTPIPPVVTPVKKTGSISIDTRSYNMAPKNIYDVGVKLVNATGKIIKVHSSRDGIAKASKLANGNYRITGVSAGITYVILEVYSGGGTLLTHASIKVTVASGVKQHGEATRSTSLFDV